MPIVYGFTREIDKVPRHTSCRVGECVVNSNGAGLLSTRSLLGDSVSVCLFILLSAVFQDGVELLLSMVG